MVVVVAPFSVAEEAETEAVADDILFIGIADALVVAMPVADDAAVAPVAPAVAAMFS